MSDDIFLWLTSFSMLISRSIHVAWKGLFFFLMYIPGLSQLLEVNLRGMGLGSGTYTRFLMCFIHDQGHKSVRAMVQWKHLGITADRLGIQTPRTFLPWSYCFLGPRWSASRGTEALSSYRRAGNRRSHAFTPSSWCPSGRLNEVEERMARPVLWLCPSWDDMGWGAVQGTGSTGNHPGTWGLSGHE